MYSRQTAAEKISSKDILFLRVMTGCDITSALFNQVKVNSIQMLKNNLHPQDIPQTFKRSYAISDAVAEAGKFFLDAFYDFTGVEEESLNNGSSWFYTENNIQ